MNTAADSKTPGATPVQYFTPKEVAERTRRSANSVRAMIEKGQLRGVRFGGRYLVPVTEVERMLALPS